MNINEKALPLILLIIVQPFFLVLLNTSNFLAKAYPLGTITAHNFVIGVLSVILTVTALIFVKKIVHSVEQETENRIQVENLKNIQEMVNTMRSQRHDFNNHIQTVYGLINVGAYKEAKEYLEDVVAPVQSSNKILSDNPSVTALLQVKANLAEIKRINTDFSITGSLKDPIIPVQDLNTILGNLIDNAIEATENHKGKKFIQVRIASNPDKIMVTVFNTGPKIYDEIKDKLFYPGFTTKKLVRGLDYPA
jgi:two-component system sensor histidine kinase AgrC